jgi:hypothetical protein
LRGVTNDEEGVEAAAVGDGLAEGGNWTASAAWDEGVSLAAGAASGLVFIIAWLWACAECFIPFLASASERFW